MKLFAKEKKEDFAKYRYPVTFVPKNKVHSKTKYKSLARSPAIGQPHIVHVFGLKKPGTPAFVYVLCLALNYLAKFEPIRGHTLVPGHVSYEVSY